MWFKNISQEFRLKEIDETEFDFIEEINQIELISEQHKNVCQNLNYIELLLILVSTVTRRVSISAFTSFIIFPACLASPAVRIKT